MSRTGITSKDLTNATTPVAEATSFHLSLVNESSNSGEAVRQHQLQFIPVTEATCFHLSLVNESSNSGVAVRQHQLLFIPVAEAISFHSRAVEFCKSAFIPFGFFGTLCTRPATKSKISARASTLQ